MKNYVVSVVVVTYNPIREKLLATLRSILRQTDISFEIVIADDGSAKPELEAAQQLFAQQNFTDYTLVVNPKNQGTVHNIASALEKCQGSFVKVISPGDMLTEPDLLSGWVKAMESAQADVSFCDAVYYIPEENAMTPVARFANPQRLSCYLKNKKAQCRYNYLILDDLFLGAAILCRTEVEKKYIGEILGKVTFAEDHIFRLMAYDKVPVCYYPHAGILYETSTGISTSGNDFWRNALQKDWDAANALLLGRCTGEDPIDKHINRLFTLPKSGLKAKLMKHLLLPGMLSYRLRCKLFPRKSKLDLPVTDEVI